MPPPFPPPKPTSGLGVISRENIDVRCAVCQEQLSGQETVSLLCGHSYGIECFSMFAMASLSNGSVFPARCCGVSVPFDLIQAYLCAEDLAQYNLRHEEVMTRERVYCANPTCTRFLGPLHNGGSSSFSPPLRCSFCESVTCSACRHIIDAQAMEHICRMTKEDDEIAALRETEGWATCPGCESLIEKEDGCSTILCRCGTFLCYGCSKSADRCTCRMAGPRDMRTPQFIAGNGRSIHLHQLEQAHRWHLARLSEALMVQAQEKALQDVGPVRARSEVLSSRRIGRGSESLLPTPPPEKGGERSTTENSGEWAPDSAVSLWTWHFQRREQTIQEGSNIPDKSAPASDQHPASSSTATIKHPFEPRPAKLPAGLFTRPAARLIPFLHSRSSAVSAEKRMNIRQMAYSDDPAEDFLVFEG